MSGRPCVVGVCRCGGHGIVHDEQAEAETGLCHGPIPDVDLSPEDEAFLARAQRIREAFPDDGRWCSWCYSEALVGRREDAGRPLTDTEAGGGFFACHSECQGNMDGMFADLAARGVFVTVTTRDES